MHAESPCFLWKLNSELVKWRRGTIPCRAPYESIGHHCGTLHFGLQSLKYVLKAVMSVKPHRVTNRINAVLQRANQATEKISQNCNLSQALPVQRTNT
jgi:hypothetical protein